MSISDIPTSFGLPFFQRIFLPGAFSSALCYYAFRPIIENLVLLPWEEEIILFLIISSIIGLFITSIDFYIYQSFEGLRHWPKRLWKLLYICEEKKFKILDEDYFVKASDQNIKYDNLKKLRNNIIKLRKMELNIKERSPEKTKRIKNLILKLENKYKILNLEFRIFGNELSKIQYKLEQYPYSPLSGSYCLRYPILPTRMGNIMAEYEKYPEVQYGMYMGVYWRHLWLIIPNELKENIELKSSLADFFVYSSFMSAILGPVVGYGFMAQLKHPISKWIAEYLLNLEITDQTIGLLIFTFIFIIFLLLSYLFYTIALDTLISYGHFVKSVFDIYRFELGNRFGIEVNLYPDDNEINKWKNYKSFMLEYLNPNLEEPQNASDISLED